MRLPASLVGLMLVYVVQTVPVSIYMLRNYFSTIPYRVEEAPMLDDAGRLAVTPRITLPLTMSSGHDRIAQGRAAADPAGTCISISPAGSS